MAFMNTPQNLLFICSHNLQRSVTAEKIFHGVNGFDTLSAGTLPQARVRVTEDHVLWADLIFAMEHKHIQFLRSNFKDALEGKRLICLEIPDRYGFMSPELVKLLRKRLGAYLDVEKRHSSSHRI
jgi:predicted protein tyrosine phosphatase